MNNLVHTYLCIFPSIYMGYIFRHEISKTKGKCNFANIAKFPSWGVSFCIPLVMYDSNCFSAASPTGDAFWVFVYLKGNTQFLIYIFLIFFCEVQWFFPYVLEPFLFLSQNCCSYCLSICLLVLVFLFLFLEGLTHYIYQPFLCDVLHMFFPSLSFLFTLLLVFISMQNVNTLILLNYQSFHCFF